MSKNKTYIKSNLKYLFQKNKDYIYSFLSFIASIILFVGSAYWFIYFTTEAFYDNFIMMVCGIITAIIVSIGFLWWLFDKVLDFVEFLGKFIYTDLKQEEIKDD